MSSLQNQTLQEKLKFPHPIHTLSRGPEGGTVEMECQDEMAETECQGDKERKETLVCRDLVAHKVCILITSATTSFPGPARIRGPGFQPFAHALYRRGIPRIFVFITPLHIERDLNAETMHSSETTVSYQQTKATVTV